MIHVILFRPEIPQNTGNIGRLCACTQTRLHLIHPLGFSTSDKYVKRSGMDYWNFLDVREHADWDAFMQQSDGPKRHVRIGKLVFRKGMALFSGVKVTVALIGCMNS